ncbi:hypothetical protein RP20_CCG028482 [Aedes albopictus]|nr:uncharacterized protein LOC109427487 [Aedes albopictus]KXJ69162.1 hypothetical protein RP20_CCG028482 [Aedes albopictus]
MAANSGVKIFRDIIRDSPCRMVYKNFTQQYSKNHNLGKAISLERPGTSARPKTAPIAVSPLAHAITAHNLMPEVVVKPAVPERPVTSVRTIKPSLGLLCTGHEKSDGKSPRRRPEAPNRQRPPRRPAEPSRKTPPASNSKQDIRKRPHQRKQLESPDANRDSSKRPCKICISDEDCAAVPEQWQDMINAQSSDASASAADAGFRHLIGEIGAIRSELVSREDMKNISLQESLELINEIQQRINSVSLSAEGATSASGSYLTRLEPAQTSTVGSGKRSIIKAKKSVRSLRFEGGRIIEQDYNKGNRRQLDGEKVAVIRKVKTKHIEKKFDEGPLRCLLPLVSESLKAARVKF